MMKSSGKRIRQSLSIHHRIRNAGFVDYDYSSIETFKYKLGIKIQVGSDRIIIGLKKLRSIIKDKLGSIYNTVIWDRLMYHAFIWLVEAFLEGVSINYILYVLLGYDFNIWTIFAYGVLVKQAIDIYWRLKVDGTNTAVSEENK